jgi:hypothetical protein
VAALLGNLGSLDRAIAFALQLLERRLERGDFCFSAALEAASARWTRCAASVRPRIDSSASTCLCAAASSCACSSLSFDSAASTVW